MTGTILKILAYLLLVAFLGILFIWVPRIDLGAVLAITLLFAGYDLFFHRTKNNG